MRLRKGKHNRTQLLKDLESPMYIHHYLKASLQHYSVFGNYELLLYNLETVSTVLRKKIKKVEVSNG